MGSHITRLIQQLTSGLRQQRVPLAAHNRIITPAAVAELLQQDPYESAIGGPTGFDWSPASNALLVNC